MPRLDYSELTEEEAEREFEAFVAAGPERVAALRLAVGDEVLDFSPESLVPFWEWFVRREDSGEDRDGELPGVVLAGSAPPGTTSLSPGTVRDFQRIGYYLAEVFLRNVEGAAWAIGKLPKRMKYAHQENKPMVNVRGLYIDPIGVAFTCAIRVVSMGTGREPDALLRTYRANLT